VTISAKSDGVGVASQPYILRGVQSGLLTRIAATGKRFLVDADELLTAFVELESAIRFFNSRCRRSSLSVIL